MFVPEPDSADPVMSVQGPVSPVVEYSSFTVATDPIAFHTIWLPVDPTRHLIPVVSFGVTIVSEAMIWESPLETAVTAHGSFVGRLKMRTSKFGDVCRSFGMTQLKLPSFGVLSEISPRK